MDSQQSAFEYVSLECLAAKLRLPKKYLRDLATAGDIPVLCAGRRMRFRVDDVRHALQNIASTQSKREQSSEIGDTQ